MIVNGDSLYFFFNDTATTKIYTYVHTLSLHDALPICDNLEQLDLVAEVIGVRLPPGRGELLGDELARLSFDSTLIGGIPPGKPETALPAWRDRKSTRLNSSH